MATNNTPRLVVLLLCTLLIASACGGASDEANVPGAQPPTVENGTDEATGQQAEPGGDTIKIGLLQPLTGPVAAAGIATRDGAVLAAEEINAAGGVHGRRLELVIEDTENDPGTCTSAATRVITRDQVVGLIGAWGSSCTLAVIPVVVREQVPFVVETSSSYKVTDPAESGNEWTFRLSPPTRMEVDAVKDYLVDDLDFTDVFFLAVNNDWGRGAVVDYTPVIEGGGGEVLGAEYFEQSEVDFAPVLTRVRATGANSVVVITDAAQIALILEQMLARGMQDLRVLTSGGSDWPPKILDLAGEAAVEGMYNTIFFACPFDPELSGDPDRCRNFLAEWERRGHPYIELAEGGSGYDAVYTVAGALESLEPAHLEDRAALRDALERVQVTGIMYGDISFGPWQDLINEHVPPIIIGQTVGGEVQFVAGHDQR